MIKKIRVFEKKKMKNVHFLLIINGLILSYIYKVEGICCHVNNRIGCGGKGKCNIFCCACAGGCGN